MPLRSSHTLKSKVQGLLLALSLCLSLLATSDADAQPSLNLLVNPSFEGDYQIQCSFPGGKAWIAVPCDGPLPSRPWQSVMMAKGWVGWWQAPNNDRDDPDFYETYPSYCSQDAPPGCVAWHMPEFRDTRTAPQDPPRIRSGENSQKYFTFWSVHRAGVYQVIENVRPGMALRFSIYMHAWSATKLGGVEPSPHFSFGQTGMHMKIGIDPTGGTDPWSKDIIWSLERDVYDKFERYEVQAVARSNTVTVFTHSMPENPMEHNDVYLDDAELSVLSGGGPNLPVIVNPPPAMVAVEGKASAASGGRITHIVKAGDTLFAIALQYGVPVDQIMALNDLKADSRLPLGRELIIALPAPKPVSADAPPGNPFGATGATGSGRGAVCVQAFVDSKADGRRLADETGSISGALFTVLNAQGETVGAQTLAVSADTQCFTDLPATTYRVIAEPPPGYLAAQQQRWSISLPSDAVVNIQFALKPDQAKQAGLPLDVLIIVLILIGLAVIGGAAWWFRRRRYRDS
jgi:LysM repeat protein